MNLYPFTVGIGASAGGLKAIKDFFETRQSTSGEAYVIILHSMRHYKSKLVEIVSRITDIDVLWIEDGMRVTPDKIFISPSDYKVEIIDQTFRLASREEEELINQTINHFFFSLAAAVKEKAIGVIMSGTGSDGTEGAKAIENEKGVVLVQNPKTAQFDGMPLTSIRYDHPDYILAPNEMGDVIDSIIDGSENTDKRRSRSLSEFY